MRNIELELKQMEKVKAAVHQYFNRYANQFVFGFDQMEEEEREHIKQIACSIMNAKFGIGFEPGGFVKAVLDNDLTRTFANADYVNKKALHFYMLMMYNLGIDISIPEETASI